MDNFNIRLAESVISQLKLDLICGKISLEVGQRILPLIQKEIPTATLVRHGDYVIFFKEEDRNKAIKSVETDLELHKLKVAQDEIALYELVVKN